MWMTTSIINTAAIMIKSNILLLSLLLVNFMANAAEPRVGFHNLAESATKPCEKPSQYLLQGQPAPCTGHLFSPELARKLKFQDQTYTDLEALVDRQRNVIKILNTRVDEAQAFGSDLYKEIERRDRYDFWEKTAYFALGVVVTGAIVISVK